MGFFGKKIVDERVIKLLIEISEGKDKIIAELEQGHRHQKTRIDVLEREFEWKTENLNKAVEKCIKIIEEAEGRFSTHCKPLSDKVDELDVPQFALGKYKGYENTNPIVQVRSGIFPSHKEEGYLDFRKRVVDSYATKISTTNAIIQAFKMSGKTLHYKEIFDIIKNYDLKRPDVTLDTVKGTSYQLARQKKIKNGKKPGTFYFKEQKDS